MSSSFCICRLHSHGSHQPQIENPPNKKLHVYLTCRLFSLSLLPKQHSITATYIALTWYEILKVVQGWFQVYKKMCVGHVQIACPRKAASDVGICRESWNQPHPWESWPWLYLVLATSRCLSYISIKTENRTIPALPELTCHLRKRNDNKHNKMVSYKAS